jgi:hypothetical protein
MPAIIIDFILSPFLDIDVIFMFFLYAPGGQALPLAGEVPIGRQRSQAGHNALSGAGLHADPGPVIRCWIPGYVIKPTRQSGAIAQLALAYNCGNDTAGIMYVLQLNMTETRI